MDDKQIAELHRQAYIIDAHSDNFNDVVWRRANGETRVLERHHLPEMKAGDIDAVIMCHAPEPVYMPYAAIPRALQLLGAGLQDLSESPQSFRIVRAGSDFDKAASEGKVAVLLGLEGCEPFEYGIEAMRVFYEAGIRLLIIAWLPANLLAAGASDWASGLGLTLRGEMVVQEADRLGMVIDVSHLAPASLMHVLKTTKRPVMASHTNAAAIFDHPRNLKDEYLKAIAATGGVIGIASVHGLLGGDNPNIDQVVQQIEYMVNLVGAEHVGLGLDLNPYMKFRDAGFAGQIYMNGAPGRFKPVRELSEWAHMLNLTRRLVERGHKPEVIRGILGENFKRFLVNALK